MELAIIIYQFTTQVIMQFEDNNNLSIGKGFWYEVVKKGDSPRSAYDYLSAVFENKMIIFDGKSGNPNQNQPIIQDMKQIYSLNLGILDLLNRYILNSNIDLRPVKDPIEDIVLKRAIGFEQDDKDTETLIEVQKMLEEKKEHDVTFIVQLKQIPAHKEILALRSSYFANMFSSIMLNYY